MEASDYMLVTYLKIDGNNIGEKQVRWLGAKNKAAWDAYYDAINTGKYRNVDLYLIAFRYGRIEIVSNWSQ